MVETMTVEEVADLMKVTQPTVYRWVREERIPATRVGRTLRFNKQDIERMVGGEDDPGRPTVGVPDGLEGLISRIADEVEAELRRRGTI